MAKYRKKPVVIEATQLIAGLPLPDGVNWGYPKADGDLTPHPLDDQFWVQTLEGPLVASRGDWIVTGIKGERYPVKPDIFAATYEPVN
jgi:hypothetical protein